MRIGQVIGHVTVSPLHPSLSGGQFKIVVPFSLDDLVPKEGGGHVVSGGETLEELRTRLSSSVPVGRGSELVVYDELSAGVGEWIAFSEGAEASMPFYPNKKPVDAYAAAIIDTLQIDHPAMAMLNREVG